MLRMHIAYITREETQLLGNKPRTFKAKISPRIVEGIFCNKMSAIFPKQMSSKGSQEATI